MNLAPELGSESQAVFRLLTHAPDYAGLEVWMTQHGLTFCDVYAQRGVRSVYDFDTSTTVLTLCNSSQS